MRTQAVPTAKPAPVDEQALKELRQKMEALKTALQERHHERNELRRELQKAHTDLETLQQNAAPANSDETGAADREEELLLPQDAPEIHPVRLIEFPKGFQQTLAGIPRHVALATIIIRRCCKCSTYSWRLAGLKHANSCIGLKRFTDNYCPRCREN